MAETHPRKRLPGSSPGQAIGKPDDESLELIRLDSHGELGF
jgi:hypothetical protein